MRGTSGMYEFAQFQQDLVAASSPAPFYKRGADSSNASKRTSNNLTRLSLLMDEAVSHTEFEQQRKLLEEEAEAEGLSKQGLPPSQVTVEARAVAAAIVASASSAAAASLDEADELTSPDQLRASAKEANAAAKAAALAAQLEADAAGKPSTTCAAAPPAASGTKIPVKASESFASVATPAPTPAELGFSPAAPRASRLVEQAATPAPPAASEAQAPALRKGPTEQPHDQPTQLLEQVSPLQIQQQEQQPPVATDEQELVPPVPPGQEVAAIANREEAEALEGLVAASAKMGADKSPDHAGNGDMTVASLSSTYPGNEPSSGSASSSSPHSPELGSGPRLIGEPVSERSMRSRSPLGQRRRSSPAASDSAQDHMSGQVLVPLQRPSAAPAASERLDPRGRTQTQGSGRGRSRSTQPREVEVWSPQSSRRALSLGHRRQSQEAAPQSQGGSEKIPQAVPEKVDHVGSEDKGKAPVNGGDEGQPSS